MNFKKIIILIFCVLFLGAQLTVILCPYSILWGKNWRNEDKPLWPFKRYPMYAQGKKIGDQMTVRELKVKLNNNKEIKVTYEDVHVMPYRLDGLISRTILFFDSTRVRNPVEYENIHYLNYLLNKYIPESKTAQIWTKSYELSAHGVKSFNVDWKLQASWNINDNFSNKSLNK